MKNYIGLIEGLARAPGAPGFEDAVTAVARAYAEEAGFAECRESSIRNLYLRRRGDGGTKPLLMLDAHADEVAFMIQAIRPDGSLSFIELGGIARERLQGQRVLVRNAGGVYIPGVVTGKPPHFKDQDAEIAIDIGASSAEEAAGDFRIRIGEPAVPDTPFSYDEARGLIFAKALDCRAGCAAVLAVLEQLAGEELGVDVTGTLSAQEELGDRGALVAAQTLRPAAAIVFEGAPADDTFAPPYKVQTALKGGPMLRHMDTSMISNPRFTRYVLDRAEAAGIPVQEAVRSGGGTDGGSIHTSGQGVPTVVISIPVRYIHSPCGIASYGDFVKTVDLALSVIRDLRADRIAAF
jgi:putative aminopeptidase FrvX